jgi:hypothetical protein
MAKPSLLFFLFAFGAGIGISSARADDARTAAEPVASAIRALASSRTALDDGNASGVAPVPESRGTFILNRVAPETTRTTDSTEPSK